MPGEPREAHWIDRAVPWVIGIGIAARLLPYLSNRSLWLDEAMLALNIERRTFTELVGTLDFNQAAPLGFLWLERVAVVLGGPTELVLRAWPLIAGVALLFVFALVTRPLLSPTSRVFALLLLAVSGSQVYFSGEVKQYAFDALVAGLLIQVALSCGTRLRRDRATEATDRQTWVILGAVGLVAVWFSHPAIFLLPGALLYLWSAPGERSRRVLPLAAVAALWGGSFAAAFWLTARGASQNPAMAQFWVEGFMPVLPRTAADLAWYVDALTGWIRIAIDFTQTESPLRALGIWSGVFLALLGLRHGWRTDRRSLCLVALPIALALLASALRFYPFKGRLLVFLVPSTLVLVGWGLDIGVGRVGRLGRTLRVAAWVPAVLLFAAASVALSSWLRAPVREEVRPVLQEVAARVQPGDVVYLHSGAQHAALFYERICPSCRLGPAELRRGAFLLGREDAIAAEIASLPTRGRLWAVFSHEWWGWGDLERDRLVGALEVAAGSPEVVSAAGSEAYLFTFDGDGADAAFPPESPELGEIAGFTLAGRLADAEALAERAAADAWAAGRIHEAHWFALRPAHALLYVAGEASAALAHAEAVLDRYPPNPGRSESGLSLADFFLRAGQPDRARALAEAWERTTAVERPHAGLERLEALVALTRGEPGVAIAQLRGTTSRADGCAACADFDLALVYDAAGPPDSALAAYRRLATAPGSIGRSRVPHSVPHALRRIGSIETARAGQLQGAEREAALGRAREAYRQLLVHWTDADPTLTPVRDEVETALTALGR